MTATSHSVKPAPSTDPLDDSNFDPFESEADSHFIPGAITIGIWEMLASPRANPVVFEGKSWAEGRPFPKRDFSAPPPSGALFTEEGVTKRKLFSMIFLDGIIKGGKHGGFVVGCAWKVSEN